MTETRSRIRFVGVWFTLLACLIGCGDESTEPTLDGEGFATVTLMLADPDGPFESWIDVTGSDYSLHTTAGGETSFLLPRGDFRIKLESPRCFYSDDGPVSAVSLTTVVSVTDSDSVHLELEFGALSLRMLDATTSEAVPWTSGQGVLVRLEGNVSPIGSGILFQSRM